MSHNREWMYTMRATKSGSFNPAFPLHVSYFLDFAYNHATNIRRTTVEGVEVLQIRCPCLRCENRFYGDRESVRYHIYTKGFMPNYQLWHVHGESFGTQDVGQSSNPVSVQDIDDEPGEYNGYNQMVMDSMLYCDTHLLKEDKEKYWAGDYDDIEGLGFCTSTAKEVLVAYKKGMCEKYGEDQSQHPGDDSNVFVHAQEGRGPGWRIYGIGNSDLDFVVTGRVSQSSQGGSIVTSADYERSQL